MPRLLLLLSPLLALAGCGECVPVSLTPAELAWVAAYQPGQQVHFRSNRGAATVFTAQPLKEWHDNQNCNQLEVGKYQAIHSMLVLEPATNYGGDQAASFSLSAYKMLPEQPIELSFTLAGLLCPSSDPPGSPHPALIKLVPEAITLANGRRYPQAQRVRSGEQGTISQGTSQLRAAWWDRQAGLLRYELASGEVFDRTD